MFARVVGALTVATLVLLLWLMQGMFANPGANDAIELSSLGPLLYLLTVVASLLSVAGVVGLGWRAEGLVGLGAFLLGVSVSFVMAIVVFGNFQDDRFLPLYIAPVLATPVGIVITLVGLVVKPRRRGRPLVGAATGAVASAVVALWLAARGARDWLLAPYGFDVFALITLLAVTVMLIGGDVRSKSTETRPRA